MCIKSVMLTSENAGVRRNAKVSNRAGSSSWFRMRRAGLCRERGSARGRRGEWGQRRNRRRRGGRRGRQSMLRDRLSGRRELCRLWRSRDLRMRPESDSCAAGFVCDPMELRCRRDGSGGAGGSGGSGTGGSGGGERLPCGDELCRPGEECVDFGVCECDPENSGCHAGFSCSALSRRCEPEPLTMEGGVCANPGSSAGDLVCVQTQSGTVASSLHHPCRLQAARHLLPRRTRRQPSFLLLCHPMRGRRPEHRVVWPERRRIRRLRPPPLRRPLGNAGRRDVRSRHEFRACDLLAGWNLHDDVPPEPPGGISGGIRLRARLQLRTTLRGLGRVLQHGCGLWEGIAALCRRTLLPHALSAGSRLRHQFLLQLRPDLRAARRLHRNLQRRNLGRFRRAPRRLQRGEGLFRAPLQRPRLRKSWASV